MTPHLIWAFVALCAIGAAVWLVSRLVSIRDPRPAILARLSALEKASAEDAEALRKAVDALEADLKPIKTKFSAGEFGKLGGGR